MKLINMERGKGKTYQLAQLMKKNPDAILIVATHERRLRVCRQYRIEESRVISASAAKYALQGRKVGPVLVDDADDILRYLLGANISAITLTADTDDTPESLPVTDILADKLVEVASFIKNWGKN